MAAFENHWDLLLPEYAKRREKETNTSLTTFMNTHIDQQTIHQLRHKLSKNVNFLKTRNGPLNHENKLQIDEKNKDFEKFLITDS